ncbi:MAG: heavy metal translocating P-type ATPase [Isosphaeraceae bacterium]|nr:heavy metal translocating P-type ATPase [Isosphaeraceae bacterium]
MDISVSFPAEGRIQLRSRFLFADPSGEHCRRFVERVRITEGVNSVTVKGAGGLLGANLAEIRYCPKTYSRDAAIAAIYARLTRTEASHGHTNGNGKPHANGHVSVHGHTAEANGRQATAGHKRRRGFSVPRFWRSASTTSPAAGTAAGNWAVLHEMPGRLRLHNERLHRKKDLCQAIERELMSVLGVDNYKTNALTGTVLVLYDRKQLKREQIIEILDSALENAEEPAQKDKADLSLPLCTVALPFAATAQFLFPPLLPAAAALFIYNSIPTFKGAREVLVDEKRLGVDVLDAIVVVGCLGTMQIFPGAVLCWCLGFGRVLVKKTQDDSKKLLMNAFGKQPRYVWLYKDGAEVQFPLDRLEAGDVIVVNTGEVVPVDGFVKEGMAMIDQHALTGESTPAEKGVGDRVFASTVMVAGKMFVEVDKAGSETASAKISQILADTAGYKLTSQHKGEILADKAVIPTLALGALGMATMGPAGAVAILNSDFGTGIRMAAPLAMLTSLTLCAHKGILVKDGRALELMNEIDTVLFDKTGTLTRERPEVGRVIASDGFSADQVLRYAAAAEKKFAHPIAKAILHEAEARGLDLPPIDDSRYSVGYGITVHVEGHTVRVGSARFMEMEGIALTPAVRDALDAAHDEGNTLVMVGIDGGLGGALELQAAVRPEVRSIIDGLRKRGIKHIAIISGDHDAPTRKLAESLGMDRYFAQVLPADKAQYVEQLQKEGGKVCFVGDGINDSIALKKANVSISLRGATSIATDTAHIVFMEEGLGKLCDLRDIARDLDRNVKRSWNLILAPNGLCILGAFTMGFGIMMSVVTNNVAALAALANGMLPLRKIAQAQAESQREQEQRLAALSASLAPATVVVESVTEVEAVRVDEPFVITPPPARPTYESRPQQGECLHERPLRRPFDDSLRDAILHEATRRRRDIPMSAEFEWHATDPVLTVKSPTMSMTVSFTPDRMAVHAKMSLAARALATRGNKQKAVQMIEEVAGKFGL